MSHDLLFQNGKASMMYCGSPPWHKLGTQLEGPATAREAIEAASLDWNVVKEPLLYQPSGKRAVQIKGKFAVVPGNGWRKKLRPVLGIVGSQYEPLQNRDAFAFFDPIVGQDEAVYHTAGALGNGERVWILAKLPDSITVVGDDVTHKYLLLSNSHDGGSAVQIKFTPIRVVCQNTLSMALGRGRALRVSHTKDMYERLRQAERLLGIVKTRYQNIGLTFQAMTRVHLDNARLQVYLCTVFPDPDDKTNEEAMARVTRDRTRAEFFFDEGRGNRAKGVEGTLWAAYNGVVEYVDYGGTHGSQDTQLKSIWFGDGYSIKARAFQKAEAICRT